MDARANTPRVFDQFTFFSLLLPGLFTLGVLLPLAPPGVFDASAAWIALFLLAFAFVVGAIANVVSELVENYTPWLLRTSEVLHPMITDGKLKPKDRDLSDAEDELVDRCLTKLVSENVVPMKNRESYERDDSKMVHQYLVNAGWRRGGTLTRLHQSVRMMARSLFVTSVGVLILSASVLGADISGVLSYTPVYQKVGVGHVGFGVVYYVFLAVVVAGSVFGQRRYTSYLVFYTLSEFVAQD
jgi:hypothetical protein